MEIKKMNLANLKGIMSRQEMKNVNAGSGITAGSGSGTHLCESNCFHDTDCNCRPCNTTPTMRCASFVCSTDFNATNSNAVYINRCSCP